MNPETGLLNAKPLKIECKPLTVTLSTVRKDNDEIRIEKKENYIE
jgi:hypothetical protein